MITRKKAKIKVNIRGGIRVEYKGRYDEEDKCIWLSERQALSVGKQLLKAAGYELHRLLRLEGNNGGDIIEFSGVDDENGTVDVEFAQCCIPAGKYRLPVMGLVMMLVKPALYAEGSFRTDRLRSFFKEIMARDKDGFGFATDVVEREIAKIENVEEIR